MFETSAFAGALGAAVQEIPLVASWASIFMVLFLIVLCVFVWRLGRLVFSLLKQSKDWTIPKQDAKLEGLRRDIDAAVIRAESNRRDIDAAHSKADAVARDQEHYRREQMDEKDALLREIRAVGSQVALLLTLRNEVQDIQGLATRLEQDVTSLVCFEGAQLRKQNLPGFCPLRKVPCPLNGEEEPPKASE